MDGRASQGEWREREIEREREKKREKGCLMNEYVHGFLKVIFFSVIVCLIGYVNDQTFLCISHQ
jgi:hypothetical protein